MKRVTDFARFRAESNPISMVTCYDAWSANATARPRGGHTGGERRG